MKLLFDCHLDETPAFIEVMKYIKSNFGIEAGAVTLGKRRIDILEKNNITYFNVSDYVKKNISIIKQRIKNLKYYDDYKVDDFSIYKAMVAERYFYSINQHNYMELLIGSLMFWEEIFDEYDYVIGPGMAFTLHYTAYLASIKKFKHSKYLAILTTRNPNGRIVFCNNHIDSWQSVKNKFCAIKNECLNNSQESISTEFLNEFIQKNTKPEYMNLKYQKPKIRKDQILEIFMRFYGYYIEGWYKDPYDYYNQTPLFYINKYLKRYIKSKFDNYYFKEKIIDFDRNNEKYIYFPLHFQPEATTLVQAPYYVDQINFIKNVSMSLPVGYKLYVKEHPSSIGYRESKYYNKIEKIPNVLLISPGVDSIKLIKNSQAVIVLSGTVGWEALLLKKPVIIFGNAFYNDTDLTYQCKHYEDITEIINKISNDILNDTVYYDRVKKFITAIYEGSYKGYFTIPKFDHRVMTSENIENLAKSIITELNIINS